MLNSSFRILRRVFVTRMWWFFVYDTWSFLLLAFVSNRRLCSHDVKFQGSRSVFSHQPLHQRRNKNSCLIGERFLLACATLHTTTGAGAWCCLASNRGSTPLVSPTPLHWLPTHKAPWIHKLFHVYKRVQLIISAKLALRHVSSYVGRQ